MYIFSPCVSVALSLSQSLSQTELRLWAVGF